MFQEMQDEQEKIDVCFRGCFDWLITDRVWGSNANGLDERAVTGNWNRIDDANTVHMFKSNGTLIIQVSREDHITGKWYISENGLLCIDELSVRGADPIPGYRSCRDTKIEDDVLMYYEWSTSEWVDFLRKGGR